MSNDGVDFVLGWPRIRDTGGHWHALNQWLSRNVLEFVTRNTARGTDVFALKAMTFEQYDTLLAAPWHIWRRDLPENLAFIEPTCIRQLWGDIYIPDLTKPENHGMGKVFNKEHYGVDYDRWVFVADTDGEIRQVAFSTKAARAFVTHEDFVPMPCPEYPWLEFYCKHCDTKFESTRDALGVPCPLKPGNCEVFNTAAGWL